ncbi:MAG: sarcosine oxidase subunit delta [Pseudolabrys sp.]
MRIACPYCGERSVEEFVAYGSAGLKRPDMSAGVPAWMDYVYLRDNPAGLHRELFYHVGACRSWLIVTRDTRSHAISAVVAVGDEHQDAAP